MPDLPPPFPPLPRHPFEPDLARLDAAGRVARTRTRRALAGASTAVVVAVAVAFSGSPGGATAVAPATGDPAPATTRDPAPPPAATAPAETAEPTAAPAAAEPASATATPEPAPASPDAPPRPAKPAPSPEPTATPEPARPTRAPRATPAPERSYDIDDTPARYAYRAGAAPAGCHTEHGTAPSGYDRESAKHWCVAYAGATTFAPRASGDLPFRLCRSSAAAAGTLTSRYDSWIKATAFDERGSVWYNATAPDPATDELTVEPGDCVEWTFTWRAPAEPGTYTLMPKFLVSEFHDGAETPAQFPVDVTR